VAALGWLGIVFAALWLLGSLLARHTQGLVLLLSGNPRIATATYDLLVLPGVVLHELSHVVAALLLGVRVRRVNLFQFRQLNDPRQGEVVIDRVDHLRMSLIGAAPLLGGIAALALLVQWLALPPIAFDWALFGQLRSYASDWISAIGLYLVVAIANTMFPSEADRKAWWAVGAGVAIIVALLLLFGVRLDVPPTWIAASVAYADRLRALLLPVIAIDLVCLAVIVFLEVLVGRVRGRHVVYRWTRS
jgi:hypothetical protein